jgi:hypothetical protein
MTPEQRSQVVLSHEGQALNLAGCHGISEAGELSRCIVDGVMNALVRMDGPEETAKFAFALSDRVAGGLREPTALPAVKQIVPPDREKPAQPSPAPPERRLGFWSIWVVAWIAGLIVGLVIGGQR